MRLRFGRTRLSMRPQTVVDIFFDVVERQSDHVMMYKQTIKWIPIAAHELYRDVVGVARSLTNWGLGKGDRVAILSENRPEWTVADFASLALGAIVVPVYPTLTAEQSAYLLKDSGARVAFVSSTDQLRKILSIRNQTNLEKVVCMDYVGNPDGIPMHRLMQAGPSERDAEFDARARSVQPEDLATLIYTSGTTGTPKGALLTHGNLASNLACSLEGFPLGKDDVCVSFLPLSHITARHVDYALLLRGVTLAYCPFIENLLAALREVKPTVFLGVPRVYEKIHAQAEVQSGGGLKRKTYDWALRTGHAHKSEVLAGRSPGSPAWKLARALVFSKVRKGLGGRVRVFISGGAPLGHELADWFATVGIRIFEGYGLTETSPVIAVNNQRAHKLGTVGKPLPNVEVKIADDGEVLVRGPSVFQSYWNLPQETRAAFADGWFKTGDIGHLDPDGFLVITDRKKDLIKTSGGKFIAPQPIENSLKSHIMIAEAVVVGDRHKFPAVAIVPDFPLLEKWARDNHVHFATREELVEDSRVRALYEGIVEEVNQDLAKFEKLKKFLLLPEEFSIANGMLTPTMKLKRRAVEERYRKQIQELYAEPGQASPQEIQASAS